MKIQLLIIIGIQLLLPYGANAGGLLENSLSKLGVMSNTNRPGVIDDQLGGYMTGGSLHTRNRPSVREHVKTALWL